MDSKAAQAPELRRSFRPLPFCILTFCLWILVTLPAFGEVIDRIIAIADDRIITLSDLRQERALRAALGEQRFDNEQELLQELIERQLIENQLAEFPGLDVTEAEVQARLQDSENLYDIPRDNLREAARRRIRIAKYLDVRFRQFVRVSEDEIRHYYEHVFLPEARSRGLSPIPSLEEVSDGIRKNIVEEKVNNEVESWLADVRRRSNVEIFQ